MTRSRSPSPTQRLQVVEKGGAQGYDQDRDSGKEGSSVKVLLDSSGWIEFFAGGPLAERYAAYLNSRYQLITPTVVLHEVYKKIKRERGEESALLLAGRLNATEVIPLTDSIAFLAADLSLRHGLAMADAIVYATARDQQAEVITCDADLKDLPGVSYLR
ncbi:MAG: PIN domain-containing protein [Nitrospira sp. CR1.3]|nr:PIN domain-containing protein [Nitrospira sp. CR1.3]